MLATVHVPASLPLGESADRASTSASEIVGITSYKYSFGLAEKTPCEPNLWDRKLEVDIKGAQGSLCLLEHLDRWRYWH